MKPCFFCDIQQIPDVGRLFETDRFFVRLSDFPVSPGHVEVVLKAHTSSFFALSPEEIRECFEIVGRTQSQLSNQFHPDGFNVGWNDGVAAGQSQMHFHLHMIPRYEGDVPNPRGGVRNIISEKADYTAQAQDYPGRGQYV
ncbi:MAG: HIT family protein [Patescibacteria group bacterium]